MAQMLVTHVDAVGPHLRVFGQLNASHMEIVQTNIDSVIKHYDKNSPTVPLQVGTLCFAWRKNRFGRARVIFLQTPEFLTVHFIDYGDDRKVRLSEVRLLRYPKLLENFPKQVNSFILSGIYNDWKPNQLEEINNEICNQMVEVHTQLEFAEYIFVRILWLMKDYSEFLIQRKFGVPISLEKLLENFTAAIESSKPVNNNNIKRLSRGIVSGRQIHPGTVFNPEQINAFTTPPPTIMQPVLQQRAILPNRQIYSNTGVYNPALSAALGLTAKTFRKPYVPPQAQNYAGPPVSVAAIASPKRSVATFKSNTLMVGSFYDVYCCFVENGPCLFSVHLKAMENDLNKMMTELESVPLRNLTERPSLGMACIARFSEDGQLYRAVIMNIKPTACQVAYVDYGNTALVSFPDLYEIPSSFLEQKIFAIRFSLSGYKELEPIDESIKIIFKDIALHKNLTLKVMPLEGPPLVQYCELYDGQVNILDNLKSHRNRKLTYDNPQMLHSDEMVIICYVESPKKFFVQKVNNKEAFDKMMDDLYIYCATCKTTPNAYTVGTACAVKFETAWYRAEITGESGSRITIRHVDFGNERLVDPEQLYALTERLVRFPPQAIQCCLKGFENAATLSETAATQLEMLAESDYGERRHFKCQIFKIERNGAALVNLIDEQLRPELNLMKKLYKLSMPFNKYIGLEKEGFEQPPDQAKFSNSLQNSPPVVESQAIHNSTSVNGDTASNNASSDWEGGSSGSADNRDQRSNSSENRRQNSGSRPFRESNNNRRTERSYSTFKEKSVPPRFQKQAENRRYKENRFNNNSGSNSYERPKSSSFESTNTRHNQSQRSSYQSTSMQNDDEWKEDDNSVDTSKISEEYVSSSFNFPKNSLNVPKREEVVICWWISPHQFYTHLKSQTLKFEQMMKQMQAFYKNKAAIKEVLSVGSSVIARYREDNVLYRAKIIACNQSLKKYKVEFVDFGNQSTVGQDDIYEIEKRFSEYPAMANLCSFEDVVSNYDHRFITTQVEKYLQSGSIIMCDYISNENDRYFVNIEINGQSLRDVLIKEGILSVIDKGMKLDLLIGQQIKAKIAQIKDLLNFQIEVESCDIKLMCCYNDIKFVKSNPHLSTEFQRDYEGQICVVDVLDVTGEKILMLQPHIPLFNNQIAMRICEYPIIYQTFNIKVAFVQTMNKVFIHPVIIEDLLAQMLDDMYNYYDGNGKELTNIRTGELCSVNSSDGNWYRARIIATLSNETTEVYYLDYGNTEIIDSQDKLKQLENEFYEASALAVKIYLPLKSIKTEDEEIVIKEIKSLTAGHELTLHILERYKSSWIVDISSNGYSLLQVLEDKGLIQGVDMNYIKNLMDNEANIVPIIDLTREPDSSYYSDSNKPDYAAGDDSASDTCQKGDYQSKNLIPAYLSHCDNPGRFFLQLTDGYDDLSKLQDNIQIVAGSLPPLMSIVTGAPCIALYSVDDTWYRAKIIDSEIMAVQFIDYGNTDVVTDSSYIKEMNEAFGKIKPFAIPCSLPIAPKNTVDWVDEANTIFNESYEKNVYFDYITEGEKKNYINFFIDEQNIADKLVNDGVAKRLEVVKSGENCFISHINSLKDFYIQMESDAAALELIADHLSGFEDFPPVKEYETGHICAALFPDDGGWYRAKILSKCDDGTTEVLFMDYGNTAMSPELREISTEIANLPFLSKKCSLKCPDTILGWSDAAETKFNELSAMGQTVFVVQLIEPGESAVVDLYCGENNILDQLEPLCNKRLASFDLNLDSSTDTVKAINNENELDLTNEKVVNNETEFGLTNETAVSNENEKEIVLKNAVISHVNSPIDFYIQFTENIDALTNLTTSINEEQLESLENPKLDSICAAIFPDDGTFYRAKILSEENNNYKVSFIDYGNETVSTEFCMLPDGIKDLPSMAEKCSLDNPLNIDLSSDFAAEKFNSIIKPIMFDTMKVEVINQNNEPWTVRLFCNNININKELYNALLQSEMDNKELEVECTEEEVEHIEEEVERIKEEVECTEKEAECTNNMEDELEGVLITHVVSPHEFYVQLQSRCSESKLITEYLSDATSFMKLANVKGKMLCAALSPEDGAYYRAEVLSVKDNIYDVLFIDFGMISNSSDLRVLPTELEVIDPIAIKCCLNKINEIDFNDKIVNECFTNLMESHLGEPFKALIINKTKMLWTIELYVQGGSVSLELKKLIQGYGKVKPSSSDIYKKVTLSHINSPNDFYIQLPEDKVILDKITDNIINTNNIESVSEPIENEVYAAKFPDDGAFYRAKILSGSSDDYYEVIFIDFGNTAYTNEFRNLPNDIKNIDNVAKHCALENLTEYDFWSQTSADNFCSILNPHLTETFHMEVIENTSDPWIIKLYFQNKNIAEELITTLNDTNCANQTEIWDTKTINTSSEQISKEIINNIIDKLPKNQIAKTKVSTDSLLNEVIDNLSFNTTSSSQEIVTAEQASTHNSIANLSADSTIYELAIEATSQTSSEADLQKQLNNRAVSTSIISCKPSSLSGSHSSLKKSQNDRSKSADQLNTKD